MDEEEKKNVKPEKKSGSRSGSAKKNKEKSPKSKKVPGMSEADRKEQEDIERAIAESMKDMDISDTKKPDKKKDKKKEKQEEATGLSSVFDEFATYNGKTVGKDVDHGPSFSGKA